MAHVQRRERRDANGRPFVQWIARYKDPTGKEQTKKFRRRVDADKHLDEQRSLLRAGEWVDPRRGRTLFRDWAAQVESTRVDRRASTRARDESVMRSLVLPTFGDLPLATVDPIQVRAWIAEKVAAGYAPATIRKAYELVAGAFEQAVNSSFIARSPCRGIDLPRVESSEMRFLRPDEVAAITDVVGPRYRALILTAAYTGLRFGELAALRVGRLDLLRRTARVEETLNEVRGKLVIGDPKTKAARRTVSVPAFLVDVLAEHLAAFPPVDGLVFTAPGGGPLRRNAFRRRVWVPAVRASVGEPCRFHDLRHTHVALLIAQGCHPKLLADRLGHRSVRTVLDVYGHLFEGLDEAAADALDAAYGRAPTGPGRDQDGTGIVSLAERR